ncbi:MAG: hypothetical protein KAU10_09370 [Dehalococcoidia bacterium]|nr:hypothetical protein [Dehalococcoidia bacterium]
MLEDVITRHRTTTRVNVVERLAPEDAYDLVVVLVPKNYVSRCYRRWLQTGIRPMFCSWATTPPALTR